MTLQDAPAQEGPNFTASTAAPAEPAGVTPTRELVSTALIAVGAFMLLIVITRMLRRSAAARAARSTNGEPRPRSAPAAAPLTEHSRDRLERVMADAEELTRRLAAVLDNKAARLEVLIDQADERMRQLEETLESSGDGRSGGPAGDDDEPAAHAPPTPRLSADPLHRRVYDLADQGVSPIEIARQIDRPTGQVELILALRRA